MEKMNVYSPVTQDGSYANRRKRYEILAISLVILLFVLLFSMLVWYFTAKPRIDPCGKRLVGYYRGWGGRKISDEQLSQLTHLIYSSASMDENINIVFGNRENFFLEMRYMTRKSNPELKILVSVGSGSYKSLDFMVEHENNETFVDSLTSFVSQYQVDGLELQWKHYPDSSNQFRLIQLLRSSLDQLASSKNRSGPYLLTLSIPSSDWTSGIQLGELLEYVDFVNVPSFDFSSSPGQFAPLYSKTSQNVDKTMKNLVCQTKSWKKLNMGIGFYGRSWKNVLEPIQKFNETILNIKGDILQWRWNEMRKEGNEIWIREKKEWISFENERTVKEKMSYAVENNLGGVAMTMLDFDDDQNSLLGAVTSVDMCRRGEEDNLNYRCDDVFINI